MNLLNKKPQRWAVWVWEKCWITYTMGLICAFMFLNLFSVGQSWQIKLVVIGLQVGLAVWVFVQMARVREWQDDDSKAGSQPEP